MTLHLFRRRTLWCPTILGWPILASPFALLVLLWWSGAEAFLTVTDRKPAEVLILETWTLNEGAQAAAVEFTRDGRTYKYIVAAGGWTGERWSGQRWDTVRIAERSLSRAGISADRVIAAPSRESASQRTYETAIAAWRALEPRGLKPKAVNVFTRAAHARRSRLIYSKVFGPETQVGVIAWVPPGYAEGPWWQSSNRAEELIKESIGYMLELVLNSGRRSNSPTLSS